jgi:hypothetical protein
MGGGRDVAKGQKDKGVSGTKVDEGCSRVMKDREKQMEGKMESTEPEVFITGAMPNQQLKNRVTYNYRTPIGGITNMY